jgi:hypothetical protein
LRKELKSIDNKAKEELRLQLPVKNKDYPGLQRFTEMIEEEIKLQYVRRDELREVRQELMARFDKLENMMSQFFDRLNDKADK